jgi:hypothetical protein
MKKGLTSKCVLQRGTDLLGLMESQYRKVLKVTSFDAEHSVTLAFEDGTPTSGSSLVGADSVKAPETTLLLGREKPAIQSTPYLINKLATKFSADQTLFVRRRPSIMACSIHSEDIFSW